MDDITFQAAKEEKKAQSWNEKFAVSLRKQKKDCIMASKRKRLIEDLNLGDEVISDNSEEI